MNDFEKLEYVSPKVCLFLIEMEQGIATGSASRVLPPNWVGRFREEWTQDLMITEQLNGR